MWTILLICCILVQTNAECTGHQQHRSVYSFVTPNNQRAWDLHRWFQQAAAQETELSIHTSHPTRETFGVQVKICPTAAKAVDVRFRCAFRNLQSSHQFLHALSNFQEDTFVYRPLEQDAAGQVIPLRTGEASVSGHQWGPLLTPMTHEAGVNSVSCR
jgi:hypothetical protein